MPSLHFTGRDTVETLHASVPYHRLDPDPRVSSDGEPGLDGNIIVQGDNLLALKALLPRFAGRVACVYIDPPYNTGNESWVYNDNVNGPLHREWLSAALERDDLTRHDRWLCMLLPRLKLLRELLSEDGAIFVSIDDNEVHRLRLLLDEVFGEEHFVASVIWEKVYSPRMDTAGFSVSHDYILCYRKSRAAAVRRLRFEQDRAPFTLVDAATGRRYRRRSLRKEGKDSLRADVPSMYFALRAPDGAEVYPIKPGGVEGRWRWSRERYERELARGNVEWLRLDGAWQVYAKQYLDPQASRPPETLWRHDEVGHTHEAQEELAEILGRRVFDTPKPTRLIRRILQIATERDSIVLDCFAGSGTTAQAVLAQNAEDGGSRRFILVEQEAYAERLTAERVRRVMAGVPAARDAALRSGYGGSFSFFRVGPPLRR